jgi:two-component system response regulator YesN
MIRVVLADDEPMIVKGLSKLIKWKKFHMEIVGTAFSGTEALELVRDKKADLLISDINMPELSGIELLKKLNEEQSKTKVIFISGFHEFEYAHAAIKFGAVDYLLKPINQEQLEMALAKAFKGNPIDQMDIEEEPAMIPDSYPEKGPGFYSVLNCRFSSYSFINLEKSEKDIMRFSTANLLRDYILNRENHWIINKGNDIFLILFHENHDALNRIIQEFPGKAISHIKEKLNETLIIAVGKTVTESSMLNEAYQTSLETMENRFFCSDKSVLYYKNSAVKRYSIDDLYTLQGEMIEAIQKNDLKTMQCKTDSYFNVLKDVTFGNREATISFCLGTVISIKKSLEKNNVHLEILDFDDQNFLREMHTMLSFIELAQWIGEFFKKIFYQTEYHRENQTHPEIHKIKSFIAENYSENIKLQDLADIVYLHPNYLSGHFKKLTGQNFKDYLTCIRMDEAEKLFLSSDLKIYEIAEKVGFTDYRHFSEVFKKKFGVSPRDYKKNIS